MSTTELLSPEKEAQILRGASVVFARDGYEGASMSRIANEAGVSKGTLYNYFDGKAELFAAYVKQECQEKLATIFDPVAEDETPAETLRRIGTRMLHMMLSGVGMTVYRVVVSESEKFPELARTFYDAGPRVAIAHLSGWLDLEVARGRLVIADTCFAAEQYFSLCQTRVCFRRKLMVMDDPTEADIAQVIDASVDMFMKSYAA